MMTNATSTSYPLSYRSIKTYYIATLFVVGNILLPMIFHVIPNGGVIFLPIFFFTLIGSYKYGFNVGVITAIFSPLLNYLIFGMPPISILPIMMIESIILASIAAFVSRKFDKVSLFALIIVVATSQFVSVVIQWLLSANINILISLPGVFIQVFGGYYILKWISKFN